MIKFKLFCLLILAYVLNVLPLQAQTSYTTQQKINEYIEYGNEVADFTQNIIRCLYLRKKSQNNDIASCTSKGLKKVTRLYNKALRKNILLLNTDIRKINSTLHLILATKHFDRASSNEVLDKFKQLRQQSLALARDAIAIAKPKYNQGDIHHQLIKQMRQILGIEDDFASKASFNFSVRFSPMGSSAPLLQENTQQLAKLLEQLPPPNHPKIHYAVRYEYRKFLEICKKVLDSRLNTLNNFILSRRSLRTGLIIFFDLQKEPISYYFNQFVQSCKSAYIYPIKHNRVFPLFTFDNDYPPPSINRSHYLSSRVIETQAVPPLKLLKHTQPIDEKTLFALNYYVECINRSIDRVNHWNESVVAFQQGIQQYIIKRNAGVRFQRKPAFFSYYVYPVTFYDKLTKLQTTLPSAYTAVLHPQIKNIEGVLLKIYKKTYELNNYLNAKIYRLDKYAKAQVILQDFKTLQASFHQQCLQFYKDLTYIKAAYPTSKTKIEDVEATLLEAIDLGKPAVEAIDDLLRRRSQDFVIDPHIADSLLTAFPAKQTQSFSYTDINEYLKDKAYRKMMIDIQPLSKSAINITSAKGKYRLSTSKMYKLSEVYNQLVEKYNTNYVRKSPQTPLKKLYHIQPLVFKAFGYVPCDCNNQLEAVNMQSMQGVAPINFMLLLDKSYSMYDEFQMLKDAMKYLVGIMRPQDKVSIISFSLDTEVILAPTPVAQKDKILQTIKHINIGSGTNGMKAMKVAYEYMSKHLIKNGNNRIVMVTDGEFRMNEDAYDFIEDKALQKISLSVFSLANSFYSYKRLKKIATLGKGNYEVVVPGNIAYKIVREAQAIKLSSFKATATNKIPCDCDQTQVFPPTNKPQNKITIGKQTKTDTTITLEGFAHNNLMLLLDVSGSMSEKHKLPLLKESFKYLVSIMRPEDDVSIVIYAGDAAVALKPTSANNQAEINAVIDHLRSRGKTNVKAGFKLAYKWISQNFKAQDNTRIILATDGEFLVNKSILRRIEKNAQKGIYLSVFNFGNSKNSYQNLQKLAQTGKGNYEHITPENARLKLIKEAQSKRME